MNTTLREGIDWVGYVDWTIRDFHSYNAQRGVTYNSYLIQDEQSALIDAVKGQFADELLKNISVLSELSNIKYIVCNHAEPDHSGALPVVMESMPDATLVCNKKCQATLSQHFDTSNWKFHLVATGDTLSIGKRTLQFIDTPMVHWPESMFTYIPEEKLLFSMDAFGQHYATSRRFSDEVPLCTVIEEAKTYYANIIMPFSRQVEKTLDRIAGIDIDMIAPSHGVIWRENMSDIINLYRKWATNCFKPKVLVIYDTMWESTAKMAAAIHEGTSLPGVESKLIHIRHSDLTKIATEVMDASCIAFGSSTLNGGMMPMAGAVLTYLKGLRPANKLCFSFGSYGWGKGGPEAIDEYFKSMKWDILNESITSRYKPTSELLDDCRTAGKALGERAKQIAKDNTGENICINP
ncbi:MAG: FprA family A-type flavoprotein [candidate division Zixibacteria bacterium]|nr:FprA family A-type flavoprotein [candidate division Zixibacteria bacterium]